VSTLHENFIIFKEQTKNNFSKNNRSYSYSYSICINLSRNQFINYHKSYTENLKNNCSTSLQSFAEESEQTLKTIISVSNTLGNNNEIEWCLEIKLMLKIRNLIKYSVAINHFCNNFANIDSVIILKFSKQLCYFKIRQKYLLIISLANNII
jgi:hypothetical protein